MKRGISWVVSGWVAYQVFAGGGLLPGQEAVARAEIPRTIHYQGRLAQPNGSPLMGDHTVTLRLYDAATTGTKLWEEQHAVTLSKADNGIFSVTLGSLTPFSESMTFNTPLWLSIEVDGEGEFSPRQLLSAVSYALNAARLNGLDSTQLIASVGGGDITGVVAGAGLTGGATSGEATLNIGAGTGILVSPDALSVDVGTTAGKIVQLDSGGVLPAVSGANLTALNASNLASGTVPDARLSANVSLLGSAIESSEVTDGTLTAADTAATFLTAGSGVTITKGASSWDIAATSAGGTITGVTAGTGLTGGGTSGTVTLDIGTGTGLIGSADALSVDVGTTDGKIVQLSTGGALPAVSGANLTALNASNLASGTVPDARLSANVSLLGSAIESSEVTDGTLTAADTAATFLTAGSGVTITKGASSWDIAATSAGGTVSSVGLSAPAEFTVSGSPVTGSGTLTLTKAAQSANQVYAGPTSGAAAAPAFRALAVADLPADPYAATYVNEGQANAITSAMITDGTIVNADLSASAAIADTKLATITTAGKVADSALSSNVSLLGSSIGTTEIEAGAVTSAKLATDSVGAAALSTSAIQPGDIEVDDLPSHGHAASEITSGILALARGGTGTGTAFTQGSVVFAGASGVYSQNNASLFWDNTNQRLGIGTATPSATLQLGGIASDPSSPSDGALWYNSTENRFKVRGASSTLALYPLDFEDRFTYFDEFVGDAVATSREWVGISTTAPTAVAGGTLGLLQQSTSTTSGSDHGLVLAQTATSTSIDMSKDPELMVRLANITATSGRRIVVGFADSNDGATLASTAGTTGNGVYFVWDPTNTTTCGNGTTWRSMTRTSGSAPTCTALTGTAPTAGTFQKLRILDVGGTVKFYVEGVELASHTATIPTAALRPLILLETSDTTADTIQVDYFFLRAKR